MLFFLIIRSLSLSTQIEAARDIIQRMVPESGIEQGKIVLGLIGKENDLDVFEISSSNDKLTIKGSSGVAICHGFYLWMKKYEFGIITYNGRRINWPKVIPDTSSWRVVTPVKYHYNYNVVTFGYTMPYWGWDRWRQEIDWMALHGYDMPLSFNAYEAIATRVWRQLDLTEDEINEFYTGPAHLPWQRMGNIVSHDGHLNDDWHLFQIELQHKILDAYESIGMTPICPGFAGFIPKALKTRLYPNVQTYDLNWGGFPKEKQSMLLAPNETLFATIGSRFIKEYEKEFGKQKFYIADTFNEMELPTSGSEIEKIEFLAKMGKSVFESINSANSDAIWVIQGWMFGYQRDIWDQNSVKALLCLVPDERMLLLDLATDYNKYFWKSTFNWDFYDGFYDKYWIYSIIPNMGGKTAFTGPIEYYANGHLTAINDPKKKNLIGIGSAPEGFENNEMIYELYTDVFWMSTETNLQGWYRSYANVKYGGYPESLAKSWQLLQKSAYSYLMDHPVFCWQYRPPKTQGKVEMSDDFVECARLWAKASDDMPKLAESELYQYDLIEITIQRLGIEASLLIKDVVDSIKSDPAKSRFLFPMFQTLLMTIDSLCESHPILRINRWLEYAKNCAKTEEQKELYIENAKRLITIWGPPVDDYSARIWSGLVRDYYYGRWEKWFNAAIKGDDPKLEEWEENWVNNGKITPGKKLDDITKACKDAIKLADLMEDLRKDK